MLIFSSSPAAARVGFFVPVLLSAIVACGPVAPRYFGSDDGAEAEGDGAAQRGQGSFQGQLTPRHDASERVLGGSQTSANPDEVDDSSSSDPQADPSKDDKPQIVDSRAALAVSDELIVGLKPGADESAFELALRDWGVLVLDGDSALSVMLGYRRLKLPPQQSRDEMREILESFEEVRSVESHYLYELDFVSDDPERESLWAFSKLDASQAWELSRGARAFEVLILDTGVELDHPDLLANLGGPEPPNTPEFPNDVYGWDFVQNDNQPSDGYGHGTHVAGTIGAVGNNALGVVGVNWEVELLSGRVCDARSCSTWAVAQGLVYAASRGVRVANMSLGGYHPPLSYEQDALLRFGEAGGLAVCAAGNDARNTDIYQHYPSSYDYDFLISVAATDESDRLAHFSNYGKSTVHLGAPGTNIYSTTLGGGYGYKSGTSMAAPHVAGAAALYWSKHPESSPQEVRGALLDSSEKIPELTDRTLSGGRLHLANLMDYQPPNVCGDGLVRDGEACDDGNQIPWDGCSADCQWEPTCPVSGGPCSSRCGDGMVLSGDEEECDDGNNIDGDGCSADCRVEDGYTCSFAEAKQPQQVEIPAVFRDFNSSPKSGAVRHPDFESYLGFDRTAGMVKTRLDEGGRPVASGFCLGEAESGCPFGPQLTSATAFSEWYVSNDQVSRSDVAALLLERTTDGTYFFGSEAFFPFDGKGLEEEGKESAQSGHNFGFTTEVRHWFRYTGGESLTFSGDDDVWVFINRRLALDLGGVHAKRSALLELSGSQGCATVENEQSPSSRTCRELDLVEGKAYEIALFHAERHTTQSDFELTLAGFSINPSSCAPTPCPDGYVGSGLDCSDENECENGNNDCDQNALCENFEGSYSCSCPDGLTGDGVTCVDRDECSDGSAECPDGAVCVNLVGTYRCEGGETQFPPPDVDECALRLDSCDQNATCTNTDGSYTCRCNAGYFGNGFFCDDLDECSSGLNTCDEHATCQNEIGGFSCTCNEGYQGDGLSCQDSDECAEGVHQCSANALCENTEGAYACSCLSGYVGDGFECNDRNECQLGEDNCPQDCTNTSGGFECDCFLGYEGDGYLCSLLVPGGSGGAGGDPGGSGGGAANGGASGAGGAGGSAGGGDNAGGGESAAGGAPMGSGGASSGSGASSAAGGSSSGVGGADGGSGDAGSGDAGAGGTSSQGAGGDSGQNASGGAASSGAGGTDPGGDTSSGGQTAAGGSGSGGATDEPVTCDEHNPCSLDATCMDSEDGPSCACHDGFEGDGLSCEDRDECALGEHTCGENATCQNAWGGYYCNCNPGYYGDGTLCLTKPGYVKEVASSSDHSCALLEGGSVRCWGFNEYGQLGYGDVEYTGDDERADARGYVDIGFEVEQVETGFGHSCALSTTGEVRCWGRNRYGQLGLPNYEMVGDDEVPSVVELVDVGGPVMELAAGGEHTCALLETGAVRCWGLGTDGQLGYANRDNIGDDEFPREAGDVLLPGAAIAITAGRDHSCAIIEGGELYCWGRGRWAATGLGHTRNIGDDETPLVAGRVDLGAAAIDVDAGWYHTCAIVDLGFARGLRCFGYGGVGQLGYASTQSVGDDEVPARWGDVRLGFEPVAVSAGLYHTCVSNSVGQLICFGLGSYGRLGYGNEETLGDDEHPEEAGVVPLSSRVISFAAGSEHTCAAVDAGNVLCWGSGQYGQLGTGNTEDIGDDEFPEGGTPIAEGDVDECLLGTNACDPVAVCDDLQPGYSCACPPGYEGDGFSCFATQNVILSAAAGESHTCAIVVSAQEYKNGAMAGAVRCFGAGSAGQLGYASTENVGDDELPSSQVEVELDEPVVQLALGGAHTCALLQSGAVRCWGANQRGQLGLASMKALGDDESPLTAPPIYLGGRAEKIVAGRDHSCALLEGGSVRCWGEGDGGRLGYGNTYDVGDNEFPAELPIVSLGGVVRDLAAGDYHTCAIVEGLGSEQDGLRCWGVFAHGRLGSQSRQNIGDDELPDSVPFVELGGQPVSVTSGERHTCALMVDGTVRCFGYGYYGALGYGNQESIGDNEPAFAGGILVFSAPVVAIGAGRNHTCALFGPSYQGSESWAGRVRCWGYGGAGALGLASSSNVGDFQSAVVAPFVDVGGYAFSLAVGSEHSCVVRSDGLLCFGAGGQGRLGYGDQLSTGIAETPASVGLVPLVSEL